jgi:hypothetical protein
MKVGKRIETGFSALRSIQPELELSEEVPRLLRNPVGGAAGIAVDARVYAVEGTYLGGIARLAPLEVDTKMGA